MTDQTNKEWTMRDAFEDSRSHGLNTDWFTFQIAWSYAVSSQKKLTDVVACDPTLKAKVPCGANGEAWRD